MGVTIFVLVSGYFGIRLRVSKIIWLWSLMFFYSLVIFAIQCYTSEIPLPDNYENAKEFLKNLYTAITPVTSNRWWFCSSYFILMMLAPLLSKACNNISKQSFQYLLGVLLFFYSISPTFLMHSLTYTLGGKCTETIILAYLIGRYIARFGYPACIQQHYRTIFIGCFSVIFVVDFFVMDPLFMARDHNLFIIIGAITTVYFFGTLHFSSENVSKAICYISTLVFPFYLLNHFLINQLEFQYARLSESYKYLPIYLLVQCEIVIISLTIEFIRRKLMDKTIKDLSQRFESRISNKLNLNNI